MDGQNGNNIGEDDDDDDLAGLGDLGGLLQKSKSVRFNPEIDEFKDNGDN